MFSHYAYELDRSRFTRLHQALERAIDSGDLAPCLPVFEQVRWERQVEAAATTIRLEPNRVDAICQQVHDSGAPHVGLRDALQKPQPIEVVLGLERCLRRYARLLDLRAPGVIVDKEREMIAERLHRLVVPEATPSVPGAGDEADLNWLLMAWLRVHSTVVGSPSMDLPHIEGDEIVRAFQREYPGAGSFWAIHASDRTPTRVRTPHSIWTSPPGALAEPLILAGDPVYVTEDASQVTVAGPSTDWTPPGSSDPAITRYHEQVQASVARGSVVVSWVEFQP